MTMKLETTKGEFTGNAVECVEWLFEMQPSHASVRIGKYAATIDSDDTEQDSWAKGLRLATVEITEDASIEGGEDEWQKYLSVDSLAELVAGQ